MKKLVEWEEMPSCKMPTLSEDGESLIEHGPPPIEWDEPRPAWRVRLTVETDKPKYMARGATVDDLRKACEVVGLHVVDEATLTGKLLEANKENEDLRKDVERLRQDAMRYLTQLDKVCVALDPKWKYGRVEALDLARKAFSEISDLKGQVAQVSLLQHRKMELESDNAVRGSRISSLEALLETTFEEAAKLKGKLDNLPAASVPVTDEELDKMARDAYRLRSRDSVTIAEMRNLARDVAERVTACFKCDPTKGLVERLVAERCDFEVTEAITQKWVIKTQMPRSEAHSQYDVPSADVPTVLAKLAGLDGER